MEDVETSQAKKKLIERLAPWIATIGSVITIVLTLYNADTKKKIDEAEARLKTVQADVAEKSNYREDLKEKVTRYTWIRGLFPDLIDEKDEKKRNFTISLVRQLLEKREAEDLFASLQASSNKELQAVGKSGLNVIQNEQANELAYKISQINADTAEIRKRTVAMLIENYKASSDAITIVTNLYKESAIDKLSPSGIINGLVFLAATDSVAWSKDQALLADDLIQRLNKKNIGPQTKRAIEGLERHLKQVRLAEKE